MAAMSKEQARQRRRQRRQSGVRCSKQRIGGLPGWISSVCSGCARRLSGPLCAIQAGPGVGRAAVALLLLSGAAITAPRSQLDRHQPASALLAGRSRPQQGEARMHHSVGGPGLH